MRFRGFIGPSYTLASVNADCQRCVNLYPEVNELGTGPEQEVTSLVSTPGLRLLCDLGGPIRGTLRAADGMLYVVVGSSLWSVPSTWVPRKLGTLKTASGRVSMASSGTELCCVDGPCGYLVTLTTGAFAQITAEGFEGAERVRYLDGYFLGSKGKKVFCSGLQDGTSWDALDFTTAEGHPDAVTALEVLGRELVVFGPESLEVYTNVGGSDFPFARMAGGFIPAGLAARDSVANLDGSLFWVGRTANGQGVVWRNNGFEPVRVSTHAVELAISGPDMENATAWTYSERGHVFYCLNCGDQTWVYDCSTRLWHERAELRDGKLHRHRAEHHALVYGLHVVADYANGTLYALDEASCTDAGAPILRMRRSPHLSKGRVRVFHQSFQLDAEMGSVDPSVTRTVPPVGDADPETRGIDPQVCLRWSDDGGLRWSDERWASLGKTGQRNARAIWRRLGSARDRVYEITITDPVPVRLLGVELDAKAGVS